VPTTARSAGSGDVLPIKESRHLVAKCTGTIGYPDEHAIAVAECSLLIADELAVAAELRQTIAKGALLHDVGKLHVDESILSKPGPLTADERRTIETHPLEGERMIGLAVEPGVAQVVRAHHERWDGSGYPAGLAGDKIPLAARVVAVADAYLAMREERPYRKRIDKDAAVRELSKCAGSQFDPACVQALIRAV
jgi:HD-GYP domain-containing protein (c-di-GMP phosphodiesterase class II)